MSDFRINSARRSLQLGTTLVEVLVTVVVISIGLLGIAGLQAVSVRDTQSSVVRSQATALADFILDRMRANRPRWLDYAVNYADTKAGADRASVDIRDWKTLLAANAAQGEITLEGEVVVVKVRWNERELQRDADVVATPTIAVEFVTRTEI
jgi:type IV pilus assembly protein PilV